MNVAALAIYLPSFLSRYSIQLMLIALLWLMQRREASLPDISVTLAFFYLGSIMAAGLTGSLSLANNKIQSIENLKELTQLRELYLQNNRITSLFPLHQHHSLEGLAAHDNLIEKSQCPRGDDVPGPLDEVCSD